MNNLATWMFQNDLPQSGAIMEQGSLAVNIWLVRTSKQNCRGIRRIGIRLWLHSLRANIKCSKKV
ncbi:hypothetical protein CYJ36_20455 [Bacillus sp. UMB0893]|nr:hypothetical protein CYJ36_20455 [Bacillus sp. UMB0893]